MNRLLVVNLTWSLILVCTFCVNTAAQEQLELQESPNKEQRGLFVVFEGSKINAYSTTTDGSQRKLIISEETELQGARPFYALRATISPRGDSIAYMVQPKNGWAPIFVVDGNGRNRRKILDKAIDFHWTPDGTRILYSLFSAKKVTGGRPRWADGYDWYILNLETGTSEPIATADKKLQSFVSWPDDKTAMFRSSSIFDLWLIPFDLTKREIRPIRFRSGKYQPGETSTSPNGQRTIAFVWPPGYGMVESCDLYGLTSSLKLGRRLVASPEYRCETLRWNGNNEIIYNKGTGPSGKISVQETSESGYYILLSVYKYNFKVRKETPVLVSTGKEVYRLQHVLQNAAIIVSNESYARKPRYILEKRNIDGTDPVTLFTSDKEMWFIGWLK